MLVEGVVEIAGVAGKRGSRCVAVENAWGFEWLKAEVLARYAQHGQPIIIREGMKGTLHLPEAVEVQER